VDSNLRCLGFATDICITEFAYKEVLQINIIFRIDRSTQQLSVNGIISVNTVAACLFTVSIVTKFNCGTLSRKLDANGLQLR